MEAWVWLPQRFQGVGLSMPGLEMHPSLLRMRKESHLEIHEGGLQPHPHGDPFLFALLPVGP